MKLVNITTVPDSLIFFRGQPSFFRKRGVDLVYISSPGAALDEFGVTENCRVFGIPMKRSVSPMSDLKSVFQLTRMMQKHRPQIVHAHTPKGGLLGMISATLARIPVRIYHIHGLPYMGLSGPSRLLLMGTERVSCFLAHQVISVSSSIADVAVDAGIAPRHKIKVLAHGTANGVDSRLKFNPERVSVEYRNAARSELSIDDSAEVVLFVGRLAKDKGIRELTIAWESIAAQHRNSVLVIVGALDDRDPVDDATLKKLMSMASVRLVGKRNDVSKYYALADVFVLPTYREGYPTVLLEAAAMAIPAVATSIPGCIDAVVQGETGILVPVKDSASLATALVRLISDDGLRRKMGNAARARVVSDYEPEVLWRAQLEEYRRLALAE